MCYGVYLLATNLVAVSSPFVFSLFNLQASRSGFETMRRAVRSLVPMQPLVSSLVHTFAEHVRVQAIRALDEAAMLQRRNRHRSPRRSCCVIVFAGDLPGVVILW